MEELRYRLKEMKDASGSEIWEILKESESSLQRDLYEIKQKQKSIQERGKRTLEVLASKKRELKNMRGEIETLRDEYSKHVENVASELSKKGLDFCQISTIVENRMEELLMKQKDAIVELKKDCLKSIENKEFVIFEKNIKKIVEILKENKASNLHDMVGAELLDLNPKFSHFLRSNLWNCLHVHNFPIKPLKDNVDLTELPEFYNKIYKICNASCNLDYIFYSNNTKSISNITSSFFGQLTVLCIDIVEKDKECNDLGWVFSCAFKWSQNLKEILFSALKDLDFSNKEMDDEECEHIFNKQFLILIHAIISKFLNKNLSNPLVFSMLTNIISKFEEDYDIPLNDFDLYEPFYNPEILNRRIMLEFEIFSIECKKMLNNEKCFNLLIPSINMEMKWASDVTVYFEDWITRMNKEIIAINNFEVQNALYDSARVMMFDLISRIHETANRLYMEPTWANDVYLVMNSVWILRQIIEEFTISWPISCVDIENAYRLEWDRLADMIGEYLQDIVDTMDAAIRTTYSSNSEKNRKINSTFNRIIKCVNNVAMKASKSSRSDLLNKLLSEIFTNFEKKLEFWQNGSLEVVSAFYAEMYSNFLPYLNFLEKKELIVKNEETKNGITQLDALMKVAASKDPSGELVRISFKSIDEEQVTKMLGELGIKSTSDHAFQDYQILAENWGRVRRNQ